jgi:DNA polymerase/3'-5' exonuclease PolX
MSTPTKTPLLTILPIAQRLRDALAPHCERIELAGSLRRQKPMVGDIEVVAIPRLQKNIFGEPIPFLATLLDDFLAGKVVFVKNGPRYKQFSYGPYKVDLFLPTAETWGSVFTIRTGSADFTHWLVSQQPHGAAPFGLAFDGGRLYAHGRLLATPEEADVFAAVGLAYIDPADRIGPLPDAARVEPIWNYA